MIFQNKHKNTNHIFFVGFFVFLNLFFFTPQAHAQIIELTASSTEDLILPGINIESDNSSYNTNYRSRYGSYERALVKAVDQIGVQTENGATLKFNYTIQIISGAYKNKTFTIKEQKNSQKILPSPGDAIMVFIQPEGLDAEPKIFFETYDRRNIYIISYGLLIFVLLFFFGLRGLQIFAILNLTVLLGIYTTIPLYLRGWNIFLISFLSITILSTLSSLILNGRRKASLLTIISTVSGTMLTTTIAIITATSMHMQVSLDANASTILANNPTLNPNYLILIGFILICFAIIQDISSSIISGMIELKKINPEKNWKNLFRIGINIGREHASTMGAILAFAWIGSAISIFLYRYQVQTSWLNFLNQDFTANTLLLTIVGTIGIVISIPITSAIASITFVKIPLLQKNEISITSSIRHSHDV